MLVFCILGNMEQYNLALKYGDKSPELLEILENKIEITNTEKGKPRVNLEALNIQNIESMDLSLSHIKNYAIMIEIKII